MRSRSTLPMTVAPKAPLPIGRALFSQAGSGLAEAEKSLKRHTATPSVEELGVSNQMVFDAVDEANAGTADKSEMDKNSRLRRSRGLFVMVIGFEILR